MTYEGPPVVDRIKNELEQLLKYVLRNYTLLFRIPNELQCRHSISNLV